MHKMICVLMLLLKLLSLKKSSFFYMIYRHKIESIDKKEFLDVNLEAVK